MARQTINVGNSANDNQGDSLRNAGIKINSNFAEVYNIAQYAWNTANTGNSSGFGIDQFARDTANSASSNTVVLQSVNATQNVWITNTNAFAQSAFSSANSGVTLATSSFNSANAGVELATSAFESANAGVDLATASFVSANAGVDLSTSAFTSANAGVELATAAFESANAGVDLSTSAFTSANAGVELATAAFESANSGVELATAAYNAANNASGATLPIANGTSNINIALENGPVTLTANAFILTLDDISGSIDLPGNVTNFGACSAINFVANSSGDGNGYSTIELRPDSNAGTDQYIIIDPTAPGHIHIRAGGIQDDSAADLIIGGENSHLKVAAGANSEISIRANSHQFVYGDFGHGTLRFPNLTYADLPQSPNIIAGQRGFIIDANLEAIGNFGQMVSGGGANNVPVYTDGVNWFIG